MGTVIGEEVFLCGDRIRQAGICKARQEVISQSARENVCQGDVDPSAALVHNTPDNISVEG